VHLQIYSQRQRPSQMNALCARADCHTNKTCLKGSGFDA